MGMVGRSRPPFDTYIETFSLIPSCTNQGYRHFAMAGPDFGGRRRHLLHIETCPVDQDERQKPFFLGSELRISACKEYLLVPQQRGIVQFGSEPKHCGERLRCLARIAEVKSEAGRPCHILHETGRGHKAFRFAQAAVRTERRLQSCDQHGIKTRPIPPVVIPFGIVAIRRIHLH